MVFRIRDGFIIKALDRPDLDPNRKCKTLTTYNTDQLSQAVSYFLDVINKIDSSKKPIAINYAHLSFLTIAFALAIIKSKKDTVMLIDDDIVIAGDDLKLFSHFFLAGPRVGRRKHSSIALINQSIEHRSYIDSPEVMDAVESWDGREELTFEFGKDVKTYILHINSLNTETLTTSGLMEESSIVAAMNNYVYDDDHCVLFRSFNHVGVATLIIYPALFKAKSVSVIDHKNQWNTECEDATHVHMNYEMIQQNFKLPKKLRTLSTGGYHFSSDCLDYVYAQSDIDRIVDCYGTATCPPPMAIRELTKENSIGLQPFKWINKVFFPKISESGEMSISSKDEYSFVGIVGSKEGKELVIPDAIEQINNDTFYLYGRKENYIRVLDTRLTSKELSQMIDSIISNVKIEYTIKDGTNFPKLISNISNKEKLDNFVINNRVEADIEYTND